MVGLVAEDQGVRPGAPKTVGDGGPGVFIHRVDVFHAKLPRRDRLVGADHAGTFPHRLLGNQGL